MGRASCCRTAKSTALPSRYFLDPKMPKLGTLLAVIYSNPDYQPPTVNGVSLMSEWFDVHVVCRNDLGPRVTWPHSVTIERIGAVATEPQKQRAPAGRKLAELIAFARQVRRVGRRLKPKVVYAYDAIGFAIAALAFRRMRDVRLVFHSHELAPLQGRSFRSLQPWLIHYALTHTRDAAIVVFPSAYRARSWLEAAHDARSPIIVPNASSRAFYTPPIDLRTLADDRFAARQVVYVGAMGPDNGHREAVRAIAELAGVRLDMMGPGDASFRDELRTLAASLGVESRVKVDGWVSNAQRDRRLGASAVGLVLYHPVNPQWEYAGPSPSKLFEYGAMGLPVIAPDLPSYREFFADDNWIVYANPADTISIARAIEHILSDRDSYIAMALAARRAHEEKYNYEQVFEPVISRLIGLAR